MTDIYCQFYDTYCFAKSSSIPPRLLGYTYCILLTGYALASLDYFSLNHNLSTLDPNQPLSVKFIAMPSISLPYYHTWNCYLLASSPCFWALVFIEIFTRTLTLSCITITTSYLTSYFTQPMAFLNCHFVCKFHISELMLNLLNVYLPRLSNHLMKILRGGVNQYLFLIQIIQITHN